MRRKIPITNLFFPRHFIFLKNKQYKWFLPQTINHISYKLRLITKFSILNSTFLFQYLPLFFFQKKKFRKKKYILRLYSKEFGYISFAALDAAYKAIKKTSKRALRKRIFLRSYPFFYLTKKPAEVRMGKGKGNKLRDKVCIVRPGKIIFELRQVNLRKGFYALSLAQKKLPVFTSILKKPIFSLARKIRLNRYYTINS